MSDPLPSRDSPSGIRPPPERFPLRGPVLLGAGLGGFVDGIVLHQILQWHHLASSAGMPTGTVAALKVQITLDGLFHAATWVLTVLGLVFVWSAARKGARMGWSALVGGMLIGFGVFNLLEGVINHHILRLHHVNETAPPDQWLAYDLGFLALGAVLLALGLAISRRAPA